MFLSYLEYKQEVQLIQPQSAENYKQFGKHLLKWADSTPFERAGEIRPTFVEYLASQKSQRTGHGFSDETWKKCLQVASGFFSWAKEEHPKLFTKLPKHYIQTLKKPKTIQQYSVPSYVTIDEIKAIAHLQIPEEDIVATRDIAVAALLFATGIRAGALASLRLQCVDLSRGVILQFPELGVNTKNKKADITNLLKIDWLLDPIRRWHEIILGQLQPDSLWFAPFNCKWGEMSILHRTHSKTRPAALRKAMRKLFPRAGLSYKSPHKFRSGYAVFTTEYSTTPAEKLAASQNLMHSDTRITEQHYSALQPADRSQHLDQIARNFYQKDLIGKEKIPNVDLDALAELTANKVIDQITIPYYPPGSLADGLLPNLSQQSAHSASPFPMTDAPAEPAKSVSPLQRVNK